MADGMEDLKEKNLDSKKDRDRAIRDYGKWRSFQGREDAEMLQEKTSSWSAKRDTRGDYDSYDEFWIRNAELRIMNYELWLCDKKTLKILENRSGIL